MKTGFWMMAGIAFSGVLGLSACGGGGGGSSSSPAVTPASKVFVSYRYVGGNIVYGVAGVANDNPSPGTMSVDFNISGAATGITSFQSRPVYDNSNNRLYVMDGSKILVFNGVNTATGNIAPNRTINLTGTLTDLHIDPVGNRLYVSDTTRVMVFDNASTLNGAVAANRIITPSLNNETLTIHSMAVDSIRNVLYLVGNGSQSNNMLALFDSAHTATGATAPSRSVIRGGTTTVDDMAVDTSNNRLYVTADSNGVMVYDSASTLSGTPASRTISPREAGSPNVSTVIKGVAINPTTNRLYAMGSTSVFVLDVTNTSSGNINGVKVIAAAGNDLSGIAVAQ